MKKLLALAALAATAPLFAAVESPNIVGYTTKVIPQNVYTMYGPSFATVGGNDALSLANITFPATESGDTMLLIDIATAAYTTLTYVTAEGASDEGLADGAGWYDFTGDDPVYMGNTQITRGCAFWLFAGSGNVSSVASGEVIDSFSRTLPQNLYSAFANPFPAPMTDIR